MQACACRPAGLRVNRTREKAIFFRGFRAVSTLSPGPALQSILYLEEWVVRFLVAFILFGACAGAGAQEWLPVPAGGKFNVSGMALFQQEAGRVSFLVVLDNKGKEEDRAGIVTLERDEAPRYQPLAWPAGEKLPFDLESATRVPDAAGEFLVSESRGQVYHLKLDQTGSTASLSLVRTFSLPRVAPRADYEGFAVQRFGKELLAVWAHRGADADPAVVAWSTLDLENGKVGKVKTRDFSVPWPARSEVRHISDLKVDSSGVLFVTSASDPGNYGPFQSAAWVAGNFSPYEDGFTFRENQDPVLVQRSRSNKAEALELLPGHPRGLVLGSDDEIMGGAVWPGWQ